MVIVPRTGIIMILVIQDPYQVDYDCSWHKPRARDSGADQDGHARLGPNETSTRLTAPTCVYIYIHMYLPIYPSCVYIHI